MVGQSNTVVLRTELAEAIPKKGVPLSFYESIHDATTEGTVSGERERQQLEKMLEQWIKHRLLPSDKNLRKLWQRLQAHVRNVAHMHRPPPQKESTLTNNIVEHPRHVAEQYRAIPTITSLPFRTLYLGGPGQPQATGGCEATGKEDSEGEQKKNKDVTSIKPREEGTGGEHQYKARYTFNTLPTTS